MSSTAYYLQSQDRSPKEGNRPASALRQLRSSENQQQYPKKATEELNPVSVQPLTDEELREVLLEDHALHATTLVVQAEHGPFFVRLLCTVGVLASFGLSLYSLATSGPSFALLSIYQAVFAILCFPFEFRDREQRYKILSTFHEVLKEKAAFLMDLLTRGVFYIFQGTIWLSLCWVLQVRGPYYYLGIYMVVVGVICGALHLCGCSFFDTKVAEDKLAMGPPISGRSFNTQQLAERRSESELAELRDNSPEHEEYMR